MSRLTSHDIETLKSDNRPFHAGALAFILGHKDIYGCHYGMKSTRQWAIEKFKAGYMTASTDYE